ELLWRVQYTDAYPAVRERRDGTAVHAERARPVRRTADGALPDEAQLARLVAGGESNPELVAALVDADVRQSAGHGVPGLVPDRDDDAPGHLDVTHPQVPQAASGELSAQITRADPQGVRRGLVGPAEDPGFGRQLSRLRSGQIRRHRRPLAGPVTALALPCR